MVDHPTILPSMQIAMKKRYGSRLQDFLIPPPVFQIFQGKFIKYDPDSASLKTRFPILKDYLNPFGYLQGGVTAALVDNTIGPLSFLIAPLNVTRRLDLKYIKPITVDMEYIYINSHLVDQNNSRLTFKADVTSPDEVLLVKANSIHWIVKEEEFNA